MKNMQNYIEVILLIILMVCLYNGKCELLSAVMSNNLGKLFMLGLVILILSSFGKTAGVLAACIFILYLHQHRQEGFEEGAEFSIKMGSDDDDEKKKKKKKKKKKENFTEGASLSLKVGEEEDKKEGFLSFNIGGSGKKDEEEEGFSHSEGYCSKCGAKKRKGKKGKREGFANLRQNRNLKLNNISVLNTTDLDRIIKKDGEVRTLNSSS